MATKSAQPWAREAWRLAERQHGVVARWQLLRLGMSAAAIRHRLESGRLRRLRRGVYLVGRPGASRHGQWMAAVLACGPEAALSHRTAAELWGLVERGRGAVHVSVPAGAAPRQRGVTAHRRRTLRVARAVGIPVTDVVTTLIDFASEATADELEAAVNEASQRDLIDPERLRAALEEHPGRAGVRRLRGLLDRDTFVLTESALERLFVPLARAAGLPRPESQEWLDRHRVDFHWPQMSLVVECDSLRYHRTAARQAADMRRDQAHALADRRTLRFSHHQVRYEPEYVTATLRRVAELLSPSARAGGAPRGGGGGGPG